MTNPEVLRLAQALTDRLMAGCEAPHDPFLYQQVLDVVYEELLIDYCETFNLVEDYLNDFLQDSHHWN